MEEAKSPEKSPEKNESKRRTRKAKTKQLEARKGLEHEKLRRSKSDYAEVANPVTRMDSKFTTLS